MKNNPDADAVVYVVQNDPAPVDLESFSRTFDAQLLPLTEMKPVVHGKWIPNKYIPSIPVCSVCGVGGHLARYNFCPNCGADMRGDRNV